MTSLTFVAVILNAAIGEPDTPSASLLERLKDASHDAEIPQDEVSVWIFLFVPGALMKWGKAEGSVRITRFARSPDVLTAKLHVPHAALEPEAVAAWLRTAIEELIEKVVARLNRDAPELDAERLALQLRSFSAAALGG